MDAIYFILFYFILFYFILFFFFFLGSCEQVQLQFRVVQRDL